MSHTYFLLLCKNLFKVTRNSKVVVPKNVNVSAYDEYRTSYGEWGCCCARQSENWQRSSGRRSGGAQGGAAAWDGASRAEGSGVSRPR